MKGIFMKKNEEMFLVIGKICEIQDISPQKYELTVTYDQYSQTEKKMEEAKSRIVFQNQESRADGKEAIPWAEIARKKRFRVGNVVAALVRFPMGNFEQGNGYRVVYGGVITFPPDENHDHARNAVGGMVTWMRDKINGKGEPYLSIGLYLGKDRQGDMQSTVIQVIDTRMMERCKKALEPKEGIKSYAWFRCGEVYQYLDGELNERSIYTAYDMTKIGTSERTGR